MQSIRPSSLFTYQGPWGVLEKVQCPLAIFDEETLALGDVPLKVLMLLYWIADVQRTSSSKWAIATVSTDKLMKRAGVSAPTISQATKQLAENKYVSVLSNRNKDQRFGTNSYMLLHPETGEELVRIKDKGLLFGNHLRYFYVPKRFLTDTNARYSMAQIGSRAMALYTAALRMVDREQSLTFEVKRPELRTLAGIVDPRTFTTALNELEEVGLLQFSGDSKLKIELYDPQTQDSVYVPDDGVDENDIGNYRVVDGDKVLRKRPSLYRVTAEQGERLVRSLFGDGPILRKQDGQFEVRCCFHDDDDPSLAISLGPIFKYKCWTCEETGGLLKLVMAARKCERAEAFQIVAEAKQQRITFVSPWNEGDEVYRHRGEDGRVQKVVRRFVGTDGKKETKQSSPGPGGTRRNVKGVGPTLYNGHLLSVADTVALCEGERDATTITNLEWQSSNGGLFVGVTSGGARTWNPLLAKLLKGKRVVLMPDADDAGAKYAAAVTASLKANDVEYMAVSFAGTGQKDVTEFLEERGEEALLRHMGTNWVRRPDDHDAEHAEAIEAEPI